MGPNLTRLFETVKRNQLCDDADVLVAIFERHGEELIAALEEMDMLMDNLWKAVPWGKTVKLDIARLNTAPGNAKRLLAQLESEAQP